MKKSVIFFSLLFFCSLPFLLAKEDNIALNKQVVGSFDNLKVICDGVISDKNFTEITDFNLPEKFFIIVLGQAKYIDSMKLYWVKGYEPQSFRVEFSKTLFSWEKAKVFSSTPSVEENNLIVTTHKFDGTAAFFIKVTILKPRNKSVRISEAELFSATYLKISIMEMKTEKITESSADIVFRTSIPSVAYVRFGDSRAGMNQNIGVESDIYDVHRVSTSGLLKGTEYFYQPIIRDLNGNMVIGPIAKFKTKGIPLPKFSNVSVEKISPFSCELRWSFNVPCRTELFLDKQSTNPAKRFETKEYSLKKSVKIKQLVPENNFYYKITGIDQFNNKVNYESSFRTLADNIALNTKVQGSFVFALDTDGEKTNHENLKKITDGNYDMDGLVESGNIRTMEQNAVVDLGTGYKIRNVKVIWRGIAYSRDYSLEVSKDMKNWTLIKSKIDARGDGVKVLSKGSYGLFLRSTDVNCSGTEARYVRIVVPQGSAAGSDLPFNPKPFLQLAEIEVYKVPDYSEPAYQIEEIR